ncbi:MAG: DNA-3-methyladenine glycosylase family protein, partial [Janthinobacterium lividum]
MAIKTAAREAATVNAPATPAGDVAMDVATLEKTDVEPIVATDDGVVLRGRALPASQNAPAARVSAAATASVAEKTPAEKTVAVQIADLIPTVVRPEYWEQACADLVTRDRILKKLIPQFGPVHLKARGDPFVTLARSIIGQQISVKAAQSVWERVLAACPDILPASVVALGHERLAACGLSRRKAEYIIDLGQHFVGGALHVDRWASMDDEDVIEELTRI